MRRVAVICFLVASALWAQTAPQPRFEVASVKPAGDPFTTRPDRKGGRIEATFDPAATDDQVRLMIQSLLIDRFKMRAHRVTTEASGFGLSIGKGGLKIPEAKSDQESTIFAVGRPGVTAITGRKASMSQLAETLQRVTGMPVWDRTGLAGNYDFAFRYAQELSADLKTDAPSLTTALQELGLKLEKQKGPVEALVIDSVEEPSEN
jgi:uncharacterized protein (TIGR03435 family)